MVSAFKHAPFNVTFDALMLYNRLLYFLFVPYAFVISSVLMEYESEKISKDGNSECEQNTKRNNSFLQVSCNWQHVKSERERKIVQNCCDCNKILSMFKKKLTTSICYEGFAYIFSLLCNRGAILRFDSIRCVMNI